MTESYLQLQIKKQEKIKIILFILRIILFFHVAGGLFLSIFLLIISKGNLLITAIILFIASFLLAQWSTSYRILSFSSVQFMRKNKILLITYNILTLNILGIILTNKFLKNDNYNCINLIEKQQYLGYGNNQIYDSKVSYHINETLYFRRRMAIFIGIITIIFAFANIWSYKYMKYLDTHKTELINVQAYNRTLFDVDFFMYIFEKTKKT